MRKHNIKILVGITAIFASLIIMNFDPNTKTTESYYPIDAGRLEPNKKQLRRWQVDKEAVARKLAVAPTEQIEVKDSACKNVYVELTKQDSETFDKQLIEGEIEISEDCLNILKGKGLKEELETVRHACRDKKNQECTTGLINIKTRAIYEATRGVPPNHLSDQSLLSKVYAQSSYENLTQEDLEELVSTLEILEFRDPSLGMSKLKLMYLEELSLKDPKIKSHFEYEANEMSKAFPKEAMNIRFKNLIFSKSYDDLDKLLSEYINFYPEDADAYYYQAIVEFKRSNIEASTESMKKAASLAPNNAHYQSQLLSLMNDPGSWKPIFSMPTVDFAFGG